MKKIGFLVFCFTLLVFAGCTVDNENGTITYYLEEIPAPSLENNLVGTENVQQIGVYLYALDCGLYDERPGLFKSAVYFSQLLTQAEIPLSTYWYDSDHSGKVNEQLVNEVFPTMSTYLLTE